jgi:NAD(P)-dependent dehydrogenase (short-subunit alcohol dehydrogenase family)
MPVGRPSAVRALVFGGYGTFGARVCRELAARHIEVTVAGRDRARALRLARELGPQHRALEADAQKPEPKLLAAHHVVAGCAGPFSSLGTTLAEACLEARVPYVDLSDDRAQVAAVFALDARLRERRVAAVPGCSSLPTLSGVLALTVAAARREHPERARLTMFAGNHNPKGVAAVRSAVGVIGRPIAAPQGTLRGFGDGVVVELPAPFGRRRVYNFESPDYDLLPPLLGVGAIEVKVGFELGLAGRAFSLLGAFGSHWGDGAASFLRAIGRPLGGVGHSGGAILAELFWPDGERRWAALGSSTDGQQMAALPCALVAARLAEQRETDPVGALPAWQLFGVQPLLEELTAAGFSLTTGRSQIAI